MADRTIELEETQEQLRLLAMTDPLTGISNRRHFMDQISEEFERTRRYGAPFSLMLIDLDNLKEVMIPMDMKQVMRYFDRLQNTV